MRFDDTLDTVLAIDLATPFGRQSAYRQLVDLIGRRRVLPEPRAIDMLARIAPEVDLTQRKAAARGLAFADPPFPLVRLFARDELAVSAPVLRTARLSGEEWCDLLGELTPSARAILRHRRDLDAVAVRALEAFGPTDFVLGDDRPVAERTPAPAVQPTKQFATVGALALALPVVADAVKQRDEEPPVPAVDPSTQIAELVSRIEAFREARVPANTNHAAEAPVADRFDFATDADGVVRHADGPARAALIGLSLKLVGGVGAVRIDGVAAGAYRQRSRFVDARLNLSISGPGAGDWLITGTPAFDAASGRFTGYRGTARRPHPGETSAPVDRDRPPPPDAMRQLVHELRTPANAIVGFAEMIAMQMLGPVGASYRDHAEAIRRQARDLLGSIDDLDLAARIESDALTLRPESVSLRAVIASVAHDLAALSELRGVVIQPPPVDGTVMGDRHAIERLFGRLIATLLSVAGRNERLDMTLAEEGACQCLSIARPAALLDDVANSGEVSEEEAAFAALPLGTGFALRLASNLARGLGGEIRFDATRIVVRLPAALDEVPRTATKS